MFPLQVSSNIDDYTPHDQKQAEDQQGSYEPLKDERHTSTETYTQNHPYSRTTYSPTTDIVMYENTQKTNINHTRQTSASKVAASSGTFDGSEQAMYEVPDNYEDRRTSDAYVNVRP